MIKIKIDSEIERRLLINYRVAPAVVQPLLPPTFRPQLIDGMAVAGICLIRLGRLRPRPLPAWVGLTSENAAHRIAVEWDEPDGPRTGVFIPRRDSSSLINTVAGGRIYPGEHHRARFTVAESEDRIRVAYAALDGSVRVDATVEVSDRLLDSRLFADLEAASAFFRAGSDGYSATSSARLDGLRLTTPSWRIEPTRLLTARSTFFDDPARFPAGSAELDSALVMRRVPARWVPLPARATSAAPPLGSPAG